MNKYQLEKYFLYNSATGEMIEFPIQDNWEVARNLAVEHALEMKEDSKASEPYEGIQLTLELFELVGNIPRVFRILTGSKMHSKEILKALDSEREIYDGAGIEVHEMIT